MGTITYNATVSNVEYIFRATSGGTVFSANLAGSAAFDYFSDSAVVDDAIYFGGPLYKAWSNLYLTVGTAMAGAGIDLVWEYYAAHSGGTGWRAMHDLTDGTSGFTVSGTVQFPLQTCAWYSLVVNGVSNVNWVRCRMVALSSITEGGANSVNRVQRSDGVVNITGYTDASPCSWLELHDWIIANAPQIGAYRIGSTGFKFDNLGLTINSTLRSNGEQVFLGNHTAYAYFRLYYLHSGTKQGADAWTTPSDYYLDIKSSSAVVLTADNTKIYGGSLQTFLNSVDGLLPSAGVAYMSITEGEYIGVYMPYGGYFQTATIDRCITRSSLITTSDPVVYPTRLGIAEVGPSVWSVYGCSLTSIRDVTYPMPSVGIIYGTTSNYGAARGFDANFINPSPPFPGQSGPIKTCRRSTGTKANLTKLFYYDESAGSYTDYTSQSSSATADDVPLTGDVDDCYYFLCPSISGNTHPALAVTLTPQANDYVYQWEYRRSGAWVDAFKLDSTENFTRVGQIILGTTISTVLDSHAINGTTGYWYRLRITARGTTSPTLSKVTSRAQTGVSDCKFNEKYSVDIAVTTETGVAIPGATVTLADRLGTVTTLTADGGGLVSTDLLATMTTLDAYAPDADYNYTQTVYSPYTLAVSAPGYETYEAVISSLEKPLDQAIALKSTIEIMPTIGGGMALRVDPTNSTVDRDLLINV